MNTPRSPAAATLSGPLTAGRIVEPACPRPVDLARHGYIEEEYQASGTACAYEGELLDPDGLWVVSPCAEAPYRTRMVVRRPAADRSFSGLVVVEWLNVSGGVEAAPDWAYLHEEIMRRGHGYVAVSAQAFGVNGGTALLATPGLAPYGGLVAAQPARYGTLVHHGDRFSFDLFAQVGAALRRAQPPTALGPLRPRRIIAVGESQSAFFLTTYLNAVHHDAEVYDGFLVHSRGGDAASLAGVPKGDPSLSTAVRIRTDVRIPVLTLETETDLGPRLDFGRARQPDTERIRTWEVAGTAHADAYLVGSFVDLLGCGVAINDGPHHVVSHAALRALEHWVVEGTPPATAPPLRLSSLTPPVIARDRLGNALGGVRTPAVDVPVAALSGDAPEGANDLCSLFGSTITFDAATLKSLYGDKHSYRSAYEAALDKAISAGFLLDDDRESLRARARGVAVPE